MRTKQERKHNTWVKILRKVNLIKAKQNDKWNDIAKEFVDQPHRLAKDKFEGRQYNRHTNNKTKRNIYGNYQRGRNWSASDQRKIDSANYEE